MANGPVSCKICEMGSRGSTTFKKRLCMLFGPVLVRCISETDSQEVCMLLEAENFDRAEAAVILNQSVRKLVRCLTASNN